MSAEHAGEASRLEELWSGEFGDRYVDRNDLDFGDREAFWTRIDSRTNPTRVLEIGCNLGGNLRWLLEGRSRGQLWGVDINTRALQILRSRYPEVECVYSPARDLPFKDGYFDLVFTAGVLIHQPADSLMEVAAEMVRCSSRYVLCAEYFAEASTEIPYRGVPGALFKRDYEALFTANFELRTVEGGFLAKSDGWDDVTWWLMEKV